MKTKILSILLFAAVIISCDDENSVTDPIYEFVAFGGNSSVNLNEFQNSEEAYPLVAKLLAFDPHNEDIDLAIEISGTNATDNIDFTVTPHDVLKIRAGKLFSDTLWIKTVDNNVASSGVERSFQIKIKSASNSDIKIGIGIAEPENAAITFKILDDECSLTTAIFNSNNLTNTIDDDNTKTVKGVVTGNTVKLTGDLINYSPFPAATLTVTLNSTSATRGKVTFAEQQAGTDNDGYIYKFVQDGEGSYDVCSGTISIRYKIYYEDGGDWKYWYSVDNVIAAP
jgi:hypothetical protein